MKDTFRKYQERSTEAMENFSTTFSPIKMTLWKYQQACIFNLYEKTNGVYKYEKVKSCLETTMTKFSLGKEILGFTMCVRDKPIGLSLILIGNLYKFIQGYRL